MKKIALMFAFMMIVGSVHGWAISGTVDTFVENRMNSDLHPVADAGRVLDMTNRGLDHTYHTVTDPMKPILDPIRKVRDESFRAVNFVWDGITLRHLRERG